MAYGQNARSCEPLKDLSKQSEVRVVSYYQSIETWLCCLSIHHKVTELIFASCGTFRVRLVGLIKKCWLQPLLHQVNVIYLIWALQTPDKVHGIVPLCYQWVTFKCLKFHHQFCMKFYPQFTYIFFTYFSVFEITVSKKGVLTKETCKF